MYAISRKNTIVTVGFAAITASQFGLGLYLIVWTGRRGGTLVMLLFQKGCSHSKRLLVTVSRVQPSHQSRYTLKHINIVYFTDIEP